MDHFLEWLTGTQENSLLIAIGHCKGPYKMEETYRQVGEGARELPCLFRHATLPGPHVHQPEASQTR